MHISEVRYPNLQRLGQLKMSETTYTKHGKIGRKAHPDVMVIDYDELQKYDLSIRKDPRGRIYILTIDGKIVKITANAPSIHPHFHGLMIFGSKKSFIHNLSSTNYISKANKSNKINKIVFERKIATKKVNQSVVILVFTVIFFTYRATRETTK